MQLLTREIKMPTLRMIREGHISLRSHGIELSLVEQTHRIASFYGNFGMRTLFLLMADTLGMALLLFSTCEINTVIEKAGKTRQ